MIHEVLGEMKIPPFVKGREKNCTYRPAYSAAGKKKHSKHSRMHIKEQSTFLFRMKQGGKTT